MSWLTVCCGGVLALMVLYLLLLHIAATIKHSRLPVGIRWVKHYPLVGCVPELMRVNAEDGGTEALVQYAKEFDCAPFVAPVLGRDLLVVFTEPRHILEINRNPTVFARGYGYKWDGPVLGVSKPLLFTNEGEGWHAQRVRANPHFKQSSMRALLPSIVDKCKVAEGQLDRAMGSPVDMKLFCSSVTMQVILDHIFGGQVEPKLSECALDFFANHLPTEFLLRISGAFWLPLPSRFRFLKKRATLLDLIRAGMEKAEPGSLCELHEGDDMEARLADVLGVLFAGFDTTSNTIAWTLYYLSCHQAFTMQVVAEIRGALGVRDLDSLSGDDLRKCPLLAACINEALRLKCPAPGHVGDVTPPEGATVAGYHFPQGTPLYTFFSGFCLNERYFDHPRTFDPLRWLDGRVQAMAASLNMSESEFFAPFLIGPHVCLGRTLAELEARVVLARWLYRYDFTYCGKEEPKTMLAMTLCVDKLPMSLSKREIPTQLNQQKSDPRVSLSQSTRPF